jgi:hypothetical protein
MFHSRQQLRRWATLVFLMWLFGVGAGFANACLAPSVIQPGGNSAAHASDGAAPGHDAAASGLRHHLGSGDVQTDEHGHGQPGHAGKSNCVDFCNKASISIPPLKSALDDIQGHALALPAVVTVSPVPVFLPVQLWAPRRDGVRAPTIPITFLRLAL